MTTQAVRVLLVGAGLDSVRGTVAGADERLDPVVVTTTDEALARLESSSFACVVCTLDAAGRSDGGVASGAPVPEAESSVLSFVEAASDDFGVDVVVVASDGVPSATAAFDAGAADYIPGISEPELGVLLARRVRVLVERQLAKGRRDTVERQLDAAEQYLDTAERSYRLLIEASPVPIWVQGEDEIRYANQAAAEFFGADSPEAVVGQSALDLVVPEERERALDRNRRILEDEEPADALEGRIVGFDGVTRHGLFAGAPIRYGGERSILVIARDIGDRKERERMFEEFATVLTHDLRNPLNVLSGSLGGIREVNDDEIRSERVAEYMEMAEEAADRMEAIVESLLSLVRKGKRVQEFDVVDGGEVAEEAWRTVDTRDATLSSEFDRELEADRGRLLELFENLFQNAVEHGGDSVTVTVGVLPDERGFYVEDDGPGIPDDEKGQVFHMQYTTTDEGTGLGLYIVQQIATAHGWDVVVRDSEAGGARFEVTGVTLQ